MTTLEDKILNGPVVHYCDAGDDDMRHDDLDKSNEEDEVIETGVSQISLQDRHVQAPTASCQRWTGVSKNTGPKGVINDQRKLSNGNNHGPDTVDKEIDLLLEDDEFLQQYMRDKIAKMNHQNNDLPEFGQLYHIRSGDEFLQAVDKELPSVLVIVHVYVRFSKPCTTMDKCLTTLAKQYRNMKFVTLDASVAGMSENFKDNGVPALLAYRNGELVKSLVRLTEELDKDFGTDQVRELLETNNLI